MRHSHRIITILIAAGVMLACLPTLPQQAAPPAIPTFDPNSINTSIALTADMAATYTALVPTPSPTSTVYRVPTETPVASQVVSSPTPPFLFLLATITVRPTLATPGDLDVQYACQILSQDPASGTVMSPNNSFKATWEVHNIGNDTWFGNDSDYRYSSGTQMHTTPVYDFEQTVPPGNILNLSVDMKAPNKAGTYETIWKIRIGKNQFCTMSLSIVVY